MHASPVAVAALVACLLPLAALAVAARAEARGDLDRSARLAYRAGIASALLSLAGAPLVPLVPAVLLAISGAIALLGGLARKPRPAVWFAAAIWLAAAILDLR